MIFDYSTHEMARLGSGFVARMSVFRCFVMFLLVLEVKGVVGADGEGSSENGGSEFCSIDLSSFLPPPYGNLSYSSCKPIWNTFVLRYFQSEDHAMTFVLSALYTTGWVGIGFSKDGMMPGASAMVGWISRTGHARIKQYHLKNRTSSEVIPERGDLNLTHISPVVVLNGANIYLAFQIKFSERVKEQPTLLAYGSRYPSANTHRLTMHDDKTTIWIDYSAGLSSTEPEDYGKMKRSHGILGMLGWGLFLPAGAMVARFLNHHEPLWFYLHLLIQFTGFLVVLAGVVVGQTLYNNIHAQVAAHRGIGFWHSS